MVTIGRKLCLVFALSLFKMKHSMSNSSSVCWCCAVGDVQVSCAPTTGTLPIVILKTPSLTHYYWKKLYFGRTHYRRWQNSKNQITWKYTSRFSLYIRWGKLWSRRQSRWRATEESKGGKLFLIPNPEVSHLKAYRCACLNSTLRKNKPPPHTPHPTNRQWKRQTKNFTHKKQLIPILD